MADPTPDDLPDDSWIPDPAPASPRATVTPLRGRQALAAKLADPPIAALPGAAAPAPARAAKAAETGGDGGKGRRPARPSGEIWDGCPVKPLGVNGGCSYYLDVLGQLRVVAKHEKQAVMHLYGTRIAALCWQFPQFDRAAKRRENRFDADLAAQAMVIACAEKGLFDPEGAVRGPGAWTDEDGNLVYHCGDRLLAGGRELPTGPQGRVIYPAYPPIPSPAASADGPDPVPPLQTELESYNWRRGAVDAQIMLGALGCMILGGALEWRPQFWVTGTRSTGKSRLQGMIHMLMGGDRGILKSENASAAAIANFLRMSTVPVALDELEPGPGLKAKEQGIVELLRQASSGGRRIRSSPDQKTHETIIRSTFLASSILIPGVLKASDRSRIQVLNLDTFPEGTPHPPALRAETWRKRGAALKRLLIDRWPSWATRLEMWREALAEHRIDGRNGDNWATILAMADMAGTAGMPSAEALTGWAAKIAGAAREEIGEIGSDAEDVVTHLLSQPVDPMRRGQLFTLGVWVKAAGRRPGAGDRLFGDSVAGGVEAQARKANDYLGAFGLKVDGRPVMPVLHIATKAGFAGLNALFRGSEWEGGAWSQSLRRLPGAQGSPVPMRFDGVMSKVTAVPFSAMPGLLEFDGQAADAASGAPAAPLAAASGPGAVNPEDYM